MFISRAGTYSRKQPEKKKKTHGAEVLGLLDPQEEGQLELASGPHQFHFGHLKEDTHDVQRPSLSTGKSQVVFIQNVINTSPY